MRTKRYDKWCKNHKWACRKHDSTGKTKPLLIKINEVLLVLTVSSVSDTPYQNATLSACGSFPTRVAAADDGLSTV
ncbi:MAG: hypothetical protein MJ085_05390 [Clostridia bacterium]|nr:hypothetical protein [Clostridia bacterium]